MKLELFIVALVTSMKFSEHTLQSALLNSLSTVQFCPPPLVKIDAEAFLLIAVPPPHNSYNECSGCKRTCSLEIIESIPDNVTFVDTVLPQSTTFAWKKLLSLAKGTVDIAAYKSSLRGFHVLNQSLLLSSLSSEGDQVFEAIVNASLALQVKFRMVENFPPKDPGDNADGLLLERAGVLSRKQLNFQKLFGHGSMHSKFLVVDGRHFYLGSANLDWRSLSQKMELGILVLNCPCLASAIQQIFDSYWRLSVSDATVIESSSHTQILLNYTITHPGAFKPLSLGYKGDEITVQLAASPQDINNVIPWDLHEIVGAIDRANSYVYIHVMDYIPMFVYRDPQSYWPLIDEALRRAAVNRGVKVRVLVAALHFVEKMLGFMSSLQAIGGITEGGSIETKIFKVPTVASMPKLVARDRRTHNKFMVTEETVIIGTSNWSGDYFFSSTGLALVVRQSSSNTRRMFIQDMHDIFLRDWNSAYAHPLKSYMEQCLNSKPSSIICESQKDLSSS